MARNPSFHYTGIKATPEQEAAWKEPHPAIVIGGVLNRSAAEHLHEDAITAGLREIKGHYGYDFEEHEYICMPESLEGEPDTMPSRRLADIVLGDRASPSMTDDRDPRR